MGSIDLCGRTVRAGCRDLLTIPVTRDLGVKLEMSAHVIAGRREGPTMLLVSLLHGEEWQYILAFRKLLELLDPDTMRGQLIVVPVANASTLNTGTRCAQDNSDEPDANRAFGSMHKWISNQVANTLEQNFMVLSDYMMDFHGGAFGRSMADIGYGSDIGSEEFIAACRKMALAYRFPVIHRMKMDKGTMSGRNSVGRAITKYRIPATIPELGGVGWGRDIEAGWVDRNVEGILNVMRHTGMLDGEPEYLPRYLIVGDYWRIYPKNGGYFESFIDLDRQFTGFGKGELMGRIVDPATFEVIEELRCPGEGTLFYVSRSRMVRPGSWTFGVADMSVSAWESP